MNKDLIALAKLDIREAMRTETLKNLEFINQHVVNRRTSRDIKEKVFYAMARNNAIAHFLDLTNPSTEDLHRNVPISEEYLKLMDKVGAKKYPLEIKKTAEWALFYQYTHIDYKRQRHFLDVPLPERPKVNQPLDVPVLERSKIKQFIGYISNTFIVIIYFSFKFWWVILIAFVIITAYYNDSNSYPNFSSNHTSTFNYGGVSGGNFASKSASNFPQIQDVSGQSGFGNGGVSGHDAPSSPVLDETRSSPTQSIIGLDNVTGEETTTIDKEQSFEKQSVISKDEQFDVKDGYLTLGSTKEEVLSIMGEPDSKSNLYYSYGFSGIYFLNDKISGWSLIDQELKVSLGEKKEGAPPVTLGSSKKQVIEAMGTPSSVYNHIYSYSFSTISFDTHGKVSGWSKIDEPLNVKLEITNEEAKPFNIGSTIDEVIAIMGTPDSYSNYLLSYKYSSVFIHNGRVTSYSNISQNLIVID